MVYLNWILGVRKLSISSINYTEIRRVSKIILYLLVVYLQMPSDATIIGPIDLQPDSL
jgi:hypothetical protein